VISGCTPYRAIGARQRSCWYVGTHAANSIEEPASCEDQQVSFDGTTRRLRYSYLRPRSWYVCSRIRARFGSVSAFFERGPNWICIWRFRLTTICRCGHGGRRIGGAIGSAIEKNQNFNDCMQARGWRVADGQPSSDASMVGKLSPTTPPIVLASNSLPATRKPLLIRAATATPAMIEAEHLDPVRGILILSIGVGGAARAAGLREHDVIVSFNGSPVNDESDMPRALAEITPNSSAVATIWRGGTERSVEVHF
jgi:hypothetical protein